MARLQKKLGEILVEMGAVTQDQVNEALELQQTNQKKIGDILIEMGATDFPQVTEALSKQFDMPIADLSNLQLPFVLHRVYSF